MSRPRVAVLVQRAGRRMLGGAEQLAMTMATRLTAWFDVDVLTSCAEDYLTWRNVLTPGVETLAPGLAVVRFPVDRPRDPAHFGKLCQSLESALAAGQVTRAEEEAWILAQGPDSSALRDYVRQNKDRYLAFVFFCYQYATTVTTLPLVADKAILIPCAHDEWPLRLAIYDELLSLPRRHFYLTPEEGELIAARMTRTPPPGQVVALGMSVTQTPGDAERFRREFKVGRRFALYLGRVDPGKNVQTLFFEWQSLWARTQRPDQIPDLVLIGVATMPVMVHPHVHYLGAVDERQRQDALAACDFLINPSLHESLSIVLLEAWAAGKPVLVHADCKVTHGQVRRAGGGLAFRNSLEFGAAVYALQDGHARAVWGHSGQRYVAAHYHWDQVLASYRRAIESISCDSLAGIRRVPVSVPIRPDGGETLR